MFQNKKGWLKTFEYLKIGHTPAKTISYDLVFCRYLHFCSNTCLSERIKEETCVRGRVRLVSLEGCIIFLNSFGSRLVAGLWRSSLPSLDYHF